MFPLAATLLIHPLPPRGPQGLMKIHPTLCRYFPVARHKIGMRLVAQFKELRPYAICVKPPTSKRTCKLFRWRRSGPILAGRVTAVRHFPLARRGRHRVARFSFAGGRPLRIGRVLELRRR